MARTPSRSGSARRTNAEGASPQNRSCTKAAPNVCDGHVQESEPRHEAQIEALLLVADAITCWPRRRDRVRRSRIRRRCGGRKRRWRRLRFRLGWLRLRNWHHDPNHVDVVAAGDSGFDANRKRSRGYLTIEPDECGRLPRVVIKGLRRRWPVLLPTMDSASPSAGRARLVERFIAVSCCRSAGSPRRIHDGRGAPTPTRGRSR